MKLIAILLTVAFLQVRADGYTQATVTFSGKDVVLEKVITSIKQQTGYTFFYTMDIWKDAKPVTINVKNATIVQVLNLIMEQQPFSYIIEDKTIIISKKKEQQLEVQKSNEPPPIDVRGRVVNESGEPVAGASVIIKGTDKGTITNDNGEFYLPNLEDNAILVISGVNISKTEIKLGGQTKLLINVKSSVTPLDATIIKGYYTTTKRLNTGSVSKVTSETIQTQPISNPLAALEGQMPGVQVIQTNGNAGGKFNVQIRGLNSLAQGNEPLFIIDGMPYPNNALTISSSGTLLSQNASGLYGQNPLASINPGDIESIEVLKDADATAIYGSRGANGVVIISTKKGKTGKTKIEGNVYAGSGKLTRLIKLMNTTQYVAMRKEAFKNDGISLTPSNAYDLLLWDTTRDINWQKLLIGGKAKYFESNLNLSGGNAFTQFLVGANFHHETTVYPGDFSDNRANVHFNFNHASINKKFTFDLTTNYSNDQNKLPVVDVTGFIRTAPDAPNPLDSDGHLNWAENGRSFNNPLGFTKTKSNVSTNNLISSSSLIYHLFPIVDLKVHLGYTNIRIDQINSTPIASQNPANNPMASSYFLNGGYQSWIIEPQMEFKLNIGDGKFNGLIGTTIQQNTQMGQTIYASGYAKDELLTTLSGASSITVLDDYVNKYRYNALFGRINYNWRDKYLINIVGRRDGSSRFGPGKQFANIGAIGIGWIFSEETLIKNNVKFLSYGKLRGSYGTSGNDQIGDYQYLDDYGTTTPYQGQTGYLPSRISNPDYAWEINKKLEAALEVGFIHDRLLLVINYFYNNSNNQLLAYNLPTQTGFSSVFKNFPAKVQNEGWELNLNATNIKSKDLTWNTSINLTIARNKLVSFPGIESSSYASKYAVGFPLNILKLYHYTGINPNTGVYTFEDVDQDGSLSSIDQISIKKLDSKYYGGISNSITYKRVSISFLFQFEKKEGVFYYNGGQTSSFYAPGSAGINQPTAVEDRWQKSGDQTKFQKFTTSGAIRIANLDWGTNSDAMVVDASFIRLRNASISYNFPDKLLRKINAQQVKLYIQGQNLFTITNYFGNDPEYSTSTSLPPLRVLTAGIQFAF